MLILIVSHYRLKVVLHEPRNVAAGKGLLGGNVSMWSDNSGIWLILVNSHGTFNLFGIISFYLPFLSTFIHCDFLILKLNISKVLRTLLELFTSKNFLVEPCRTSTIPFVWIDWIYLHWRFNQMSPTGSKCILRSLKMSSFNDLAFYSPKKQRTLKNPPPTMLRSYNSKWMLYWHLSQLHWPWHSPMFDHCGSFKLQHYHYHLTKSEVRIELQPIPKHFDFMCSRIWE